MISYTGRGEPVIHRNKGVVNVVVCECLECGAKVYVEDILNDVRCPKCNGPLGSIGKATREIR